MAAELEPVAIVEAAPVAFVQESVGEAPAADETLGAAPQADVPVLIPVLAQATVRAYRDRMLLMRERFATSPVLAVAEAEQLVDDALSELRVAMLAQARGLADWRHEPMPDLTLLDTALRRYHEYLDAVLAL